MRKGARTLSLRLPRTVKKEDESEIHELEATAGEAVGADLEVPQGPHFALGKRGLCPCLCRRRLHNRWGEKKGTALMCCKSRCVNTSRHRAWWNYQNRYNQDRQKRRDPRREILTCGRACNAGYLARVSCPFPGPCEEQQ